MESIGGMTALMEASREGHTATVQVLLEAGADVNVKEKVSGVNTIALWLGGFDGKYRWLDGADLGILGGTQSLSSGAAGGGGRCQCAGLDW